MKLVGRKEILKKIRKDNERVITNAELAQTN